MRVKGVCPGSPSGVFFWALLSIFDQFSILMLVNTQLSLLLFLSVTALLSWRLPPTSKLFSEVLDYKADKQARQSDILEVGFKAQWRPETHDWCSGHPSTLINWHLCFFVLFLSLFCKIEVLRINELPRLRLYCPYLFIFLQRCSSPGLFLAPLPQFQLTKLVSIPCSFFFYFTI